MSANVEAAAAATTGQQQQQRPSQQIHNHDLIDEFIIHRTDRLARLELHTEYIKMYHLGKQSNKKSLAPDAVADLILNLNDVAGSSVCRGKEDADMTSYLTIYAYIKPKNQSTTRVKRKRRTYEFAYSKLPTYDENFAHVNKWHLKLYNLLRLKTFIHQQHLLNSIDTTHSNNARHSSEYRELLLAKPFLVFVNPKSGSGRAKNIYFERALPVWAEANIPDTTVFTQHANFAREYVRNMNLEDYSGIVVVSGDGLVYEVINGLMERPDWRRAIKIPIGQIPGGSANALACCTAYVSGEVYKGLTLESFATQTAFNISKSISVPMDLVRYELSDKSVIYSSLVMEWAIVADVDFESEKYRYLGGLRFLVGALKRVYFENIYEAMRIYRGRISFILADQSETYTPRNKSIKVNRLTGASTRRQETPDTAPTTSTSALADDNEDFSPHTFKYLPPIDQPLSGDEWHVIEENFVFLIVVYLPLIAPDFLAVPESKFDDGNMHLIFIKEGISRAQLLNLFQKTEEGNHLSSDMIEHVKVKAFRLEPLTFDASNSRGHGNYQDSGIMMIDGERVPYGIVQGEMIPKMANVLINMNK